MSPKKLFYSPYNAPESGLCHILSMGIHEDMRPRYFHYLPEQAEYLLIVMHQPNLIKGVDGKWREYAKGCMLFTAESVRTYGHPDQDWDHSWILFRGTAAAALIRQHPFPCNTMMELDADAIVHHFFTQLYAELSSGRRQIDYIIDAMLNLIFAQIRRLAEPEQETIPLNIIQAEKFMMENIRTPLQLTEIAAQASLSVSRFLVLFKEYYHETPGHYVNRMKMMLAARMLRQNAGSCKEIAEELGFADQLYFSRRFKQYWGMAPGGYRNNWRPRSADGGYEKSGR